ncbi:hypothetical protein [Levilactobacillus humaensis]|uniref:hypothetical protein n=1 Tax=Levilactobacillus humaensis TaxID=2950375 RepID=UPI0021C35322|nr:hypothetical protein [Levilactobacillus humaensis]
MGISRFIGGLTLATGVGLAAYLTLTKQDPITWAKHLKDQAQHTATKVSEAQSAQERLTQSVQKLGAAVDASTPALEDIQKDIEKFQFKIAPRVAVIQETLDRWEQD